MRLLSADSCQLPSNPTKLVALFIVFFGFIVLLNVIGIEPSTRFRFLNPMNPRNSINSMNPIPLGPFVCWEARMPGSQDSAAR